MKKFNVYHDFNAEGFNIDHIAVGPTGIFAIETKGRAKRSKTENENWKVEFNGKKLKFPGWTETKPVEQARIQANWLKKWIQQATGENLNVFPVLAIPGWYINRKGNSDILIYNGKNPSFLEKRNAILTEKQVRTVSFQIEKE